MTLSSSDKLSVNFLINPVDVDPGPPATTAVNATPSIMHTNRANPYPLGRPTRMDIRSLINQTTTGLGSGTQPSALPVQHVEGRGCAPGVAAAASRYRLIHPKPGTGTSTSPFAGTGTGAGVGSSTALGAIATVRGSAARPLSQSQSQSQQSSLLAQPSTNQISARRLRLKDYLASDSATTARPNELAANEFKKVIRKLVFDFPEFVGYLQLPDSSDVFDTAKSADTQLLLTNHAHVLTPAGTARRQAVDNFILQHTTATTLETLAPLDANNDRTLLVRKELLRTQIPGIDAILLNAPEIAQRQTEKNNWYDASAIVRKFVAAFLHVRSVIAPEVGTNIALNWNGNQIAIAKLELYEPAFHVSAGRGRAAVSAFIDDLKNGSVTAPSANAATQWLQSGPSHPAS